jgi:aminobenzoyl-glutamate utilization protein B
MSKDTIFETARTWIDGNTEEIAALTDRIWAYAEPSFCETRSAEALCDLLAGNGFAVDMGVAHMPSAFVASWGSGRPTQRAA